MNTIQNYLFDKANGESQSKFEENNFEAYPLSIVDSDNNLLDGFLQDATATVSEYEGVQTHTLEVVWMQKDVNKAYIITKTCKAPKGCIVRWDDVHCSFEFGKLDFSQ